MVKRVAHYDLEDMKTNYLPMVYDLFNLPHNQSQRRQIEASFEKQRSRYATSLSRHSFSAKADR